MCRIRTLSLLLLPLFAVACGPNADRDEPVAGGAPPELTLPADAEAAAEAIDAETLETIVRALSDDALAGRGPATEGDLAARAYMAAKLAEYGFEPGGADGGWEQPVELVGLHSKPPETWSFRAGDTSLDLDTWDDFIAVSGVQRPRVSIDDAELVFVGYGITAPEEDWDDFAGVDVSGKVLLMLNDDPNWDPDLFAGTKRLYYGRWTYKYESAARAGAVGAIIVHTTPSAGYGWNVVQSSWTGVQFEAPAGDEPRIEVAGWVTEDAARALVALGGHDLDALVDSARSRDFSPRPLGIRTSIAFDVEIDRGTTSANVLGVLPGSDPERADEYVVYTAHHDHLGVATPDADGDAIYNGARDNASGVATVLAIAKAFSALEERPARSILMLLVGAEEQGLLGSKVFAANPTVHPGNLMANVNFDSAAIFGRSEDVAVIGRGKSGLEALLEQAAAKQDRRVVEEPSPDKGYYYRSDQFSLAKIGVPALYFKSGHTLRDGGPALGERLETEWRERHYHQPSDEIRDDWKFDGMVEDARLGFWVGLSVATMDDPPGWTPGDEFEAIRERMRAEAP